MKKILVILMILCMVFVTACSSSNAEIDKIISEKNDTVHEIKDEDFDETLESYKQMYQAQVGEERWGTLKDDTSFIQSLEQMVLKNMILEKIFIDEAQKNKITVTDEDIFNEFKSFTGSYSSEEEYQASLKSNNLTEEIILERIEKQLIIDKFVEYKKNIIGDIKVPENELKKFYDENKSQYVKVRASHILVDSYEKAEELKKKLDEGADFAELAKENSSCPSKENGGDLGYFASSDMVKEFSTVAFSLDKDQISDPVQTSYGWHIIKVTDKQTDYDSVDKTELESGYKNLVFQKMCNNYIENAKLTISDKLQTIEDRSKSNDKSTTEEK